MFLFTTAPVDGDIAVRILRQRSEQNGTHVRKTGAARDQNQRTVFVFTQPRFAMRNVDLNFTLFQDAIHNSHGIKIKL
ncbi:hypothetical protein D3C78_1734510 [compost metagenome]